MSTQEDLMAQMVANAQISVPPTAVQPGLTMPNMPGMAPVAAPQPMMAPVPQMQVPVAQTQVAQVDAQTQVGIHSLVGVQPTPEQLAILAAQQNPVHAPSIEQQVIETPVQTLATEIASVPEIPAIPTTNIGTQLNLQNGLDLEAVMTPEEQVKLEVAEVVATPIVINGLESIGSCKTSVWSALITILDFIAKGLSNNEVISIDKGTIDTQRDGIFIHCDMKNILGNISLNLTSPEASVKLLKLIRGGELVQIFKEDATNHYIFCNIQDSRVLTKVKTSFAADQVEGFGKAPLLGNPIFQKEIPNAEKEIIKTIIAGKAAIGGSDEAYRFGFSKTDNSLVSIGVGKDFTHYFKDSSIEIDEYKCYNPFPVPNMESCIIRFFKKADDNTTWIQTVSNINPSSIICTEKVELIDSTIEDFNFN